MKYSAAIPFLFAGLLLQAGEHATLKDVADLQWKNRIILIHVTQDTDAILTQLQGHAAGIDDRDIIWFIFRSNRILTNYTGLLSEDFSSTIRQRYGNGQNEVILLGKDGGIKSRSGNLDLKTLFSTIDAMPMRQYEMRH